MQSISEHLVLLSRPHQGPGVLVHSAQAGGFVTLWGIRACNLDDEDRAPNENNNAQNATCRITIGHRKIAIHVALTYDSKMLISNLWVNPGEEVWVSTSQPKYHAVYGFVHSQHSKPVVVS